MYDACRFHIVCYVSYNLITKLVMVLFDSQLDDAHVDDYLSLMSLELLRFFVWVSHECLQTLIVVKLQMCTVFTQSCTNYVRSRR